jgi:hypothetical protein
VQHPVKQFHSSSNIRQKLLTFHKLNIKVKNGILAQKKKKEEKRRKRL